MPVRVRIAPSPTGNLHIGTARTALFNWLFARHHGGEFILRIEDTDLERSKKEYEENIIEGLHWLGLQWDNEHIARQTERLPLYRSYLERLLESGAAFWREYTAEEKADMERDGRAARDRVIALTPPSDPERELAFDDQIRGRVAVQAKHVGQVVLAKDLDTPLYNFAVVVDDLDMNITHVIRGEDHISNTPKQLLIYEALGATPPVFAHLPLILGPDRSKMSKRHGATNIADYQADYLPEALVSFMGQLGYTYDAELLSLDEMAKQFDLARVHKSGAVFDQTKLNWTNAQYLKRLPPATFKQLIGKPDLPDSAVPIMTERLERLTDIAQFSYFWEEPEYESALLSWKDDAPEVTRAALELCADLAARGELNQPALDAAALEQFAGKKGSVYWPLRVALSGRQNSAGPLEIAAAIGSERTQSRIQTAIHKLAT
ncbi:MAG: glutamate--tRNA ligase [Candidatus Yanofskybacteria bacterium]|nr:glutamate--tRNA ligase [Candidatus Yanofskybacteria bacterium]